MKLIFMGTPEFAAVILRRVLAWDKVQMLAVYTQPDRPAGRGHKLSPSPVKLLALERGIPVLQPLNFKNADDVEKLAAFEPDALVVAAYGLILPQRVLDIPRWGAFNAHASLLPKYRGAAPIQRAIMAGDAVTGMTIMRMERGLDTGPILLQRALAIGIHDTAARIHEELADMGGELMVEALEKIENGSIRPVAQDHAQATHAAKLTKEDGRIDWNRPVLEVHARIRGVTPWPGAYTDLERSGCEQIRVSLEPGEPGAALEPGTSPGTIGALLDGTLPVACADRWYLLSSLRPAGKKTADATAFVNGYLARCAHAVFALPEDGRSG